MFLVLFRGKSAIFACHTTRKLRIIPILAYATIACATCALTGVTKIKFFVLHVALPSASTAQR